MHELPSNPIHTIQMKQTGELLEKVCTYNVWSARCPSRRLLDLIADKWSTLKIRDGGGVYAGTRRNSKGVARGADGLMVLTLIDNQVVAVHTEEVHR